MDIKIFGSRAEMGRAASQRFVEEVNRLLADKAFINIIFAAAPSQNEFLEELSKQVIPWIRMNAFHMDEYIGLPPGAPQGFGNFLRTRLFNKVNFNSVNYLNGNTDNPSTECKRYTDLLTQLAPDLVCMGIGENCHLAFNDPPVADFNDPLTVKVVELDEVCRMQQVNDGCFATFEEVPTHALTLTIPVLLSADVINCVVPGPTKANAVYHTVNSPIAEQYPSTVLRNHAGAVLFLDTDSGRLL